MSDTVFIALLTAIPPTLVALAGFIVTLKNGVKSDKIHVLVNSNMTKVQADLAAARLNIEELQVVISKLVEVRVPPVPNTVPGAGSIG